MSKNQSANGHNSTGRAVNRRDFLKLSGAGIAGPALLGVSGCGGDQGAKGGKVQLKLWHQEQPPHRVQQFQKVIDAFNNSQKDIHVEQQPQNWADVYKKTPAAIQAGTQPDIQFTIPDFTATIKKTGAVQPLENVLEQLDGKHNFLDQTVQPYEYDGHTWAIPLYGMVQVLWYRKDMFKSAGLDPDRPPRDWDELRSYAAKLTGNGKHGIGIPSSKHLYTDQEFWTFLLCNGGYIFNKNGEVDFNTPATAETMALYKDLSTYSPPGSSSWTWAEPQAAFNNGTLAMAIEKGQFLAPFQEESGQSADALGAAPVPWTLQGQRGSYYASNGAMLLTDEPHKKEAATEFLKFVLEPKTYTTFLLAEPGLFLPVTNKAPSGWQNSKVLSKYPEAVDLMLDQSRHGYSIGFRFQRSEVPDGLPQIAGSNLLSQSVQKAVVDKSSAKAAVAWGQNEMEAAG